MRVDSRQLTKLRQATLAWGDLIWSFHCQKFRFFDLKKYSFSALVVRPFNDPQIIKISQFKSAEVFFYSAECQFDRVSFMTSAWRPFVIFKMVIASVLELSIESALNRMNVFSYYSRKGMEYSPPYLYS